MRYCARMTWTERTAPIKVGDEVAYAAAFLKNTGQQAGEAGHARGTVTALIPVGEMTLAQITWHNADMPERVNVKNLARVGGKGFALD